MAKFVFRKKENMTISKPMYFAIGLLVVLLIIGVIFFIFLKYSPIMNFKYEGYAISGKEITENLLGSGNSKNNAINSNANKNIELTKIEEQGTIFKKLNDYFVGSKEKKEINLNYPIYINNNSAIYNLAESSTLISKDFEEIAGYPNLSISEGKVYDGNNLERADGKEYIFVKTADEIYINLVEIKIKTTANEYIIPVNSIIAFTENSIRYYSIKNNILVFNEINDVDSNSNVQMVENSYTYEELLTRLGILQKQSTNTENNDTQTNIIKEDNTTSNTEENEVKQEESTEKNTNDEQQAQNGYIKPEVSVEDFTAEVYTAKSVLTIKDSAERIVEAPTFEIYKDSKIYLRRTYTNSGNITVTGLVPETEYKIVGRYIYLNENNQKVENTFYEGSFTTKGYEELGSIDITKENGEIYSNKIQLTKVKITSDLNAEAIKGINQVEIETGEIRTVLKNSQVNELLQGKEITIESSEGLKSNSKIEYAIKFYDKNGIELKVNNNEGETRTSKDMPTARITMKEQNIVSVKLGLKLTNRDNVELENYKYIVARPNGEVVQEKRLSENEKELLLEDLDQNQYYKISIYADYDLNDNKGKQENVEIGNLVFATQPISTLGSLELTVENKELTSTTSTISYKIDEDRTDKRLIQILNELTINIKDGENIVKTDILTGEEISNLQQAGTKEIKYENLESNTTYTIEITGNVQLGNTQESIPVTYNYKEFTTLKIPAKVEIKNQFVTGNLIDFDVRIEDINNSVLNNKVRMELRNSSNDLIDLQEVTTNEDYIRKTYEKLEENQTYKLSFYADQYNEGSTDETYKVNYLITELEIVTEPGISGSIGLTELTRKATGKNLVDVNSKVKWYADGFNRTVYGKEYNQEENSLKLYAGQNGQIQQYLYDLSAYVGEQVTISFEARIEGNPNMIRILNGTEYNINYVEIKDNLSSEWVSYEQTLTVGDEGYVGFFVQSKGALEDVNLYVKNLQIELGARKTAYEPYEYILDSSFNINLEDKRDEITTNDYFLKIYEDNTLIKTDRYEEISENNIIENIEKEYEVNSDKTYKVELVINIRDREYVLDEIEFNTNNSEEIKGIYTLEDYQKIQPEGKYIVLNDLDLTKLATRRFRLEFNGEIDFNGHNIYTTFFSSADNLYATIGNRGTIKNIVLNLKLPKQAIITYAHGCLFSYNYGTITNIQFNIIESYNVANRSLCLLGGTNLGIIEKFILNVQQKLYGQTELSLCVRDNYGTIKNGYIYGDGVELSSLYTASANSYVSGIATYNRGTIENVFTNFEITKTYERDMDKYSGDLVCINYGTVNNVYSIKIGDLISGPNIGAIDGGTINNAYYFSNQVLEDSTEILSSKLALYETEFQNQVLNSQNSFDVDNTVTKGYFPHIIMPDIMPAQPYINLPEVQDKDLVDILSTKVIENNNENVKVEFSINNLAGEDIQSIEIKNIKTTILSQEYNDGKTKVIALLSNPTMYVSNYSVLSITSKGAYNIPYTRNFEEGERNIQVDLYKTIYTVDDWKQINKSPTENYKLMNDLDFKNEGNSVSIKNVFNGKLDGNNYEIRNYNSDIALLWSVQNATIENIFINNVNLRQENYTYLAIIGTANLSNINNVHVKNIKIVLSKNQDRTYYLGGLIGRAVNGTVINSCSVSEMNLESSNIISIAYTGTIVGYSNGSIVENTYSQNINLNLKNIIDLKIGGIIGIENAAQGKIINSYAIGNINIDKGEVGGIVGNSYGSINNTYSWINIETMSDNAGGIAGYDQSNVNDISLISNNLVIGNVYSSKNSEFIGRIVGRSVKENNNNYVYEYQKLNGNSPGSSNNVIKNTDIKSRNVYKEILNWGDVYDFTDYENGRLPQLLNSATNEILPNQEAHYLKSEEKFTVSQIETAKTNSSTVQIRLEILTPTNVEITNIDIENMNVTIQNIQKSNNKTYINLAAEANKYYDNYKLSGIRYIENNEEKVEDIEIPIHLILYKEIYTFEDWQNIEGDYQNYKLMSDIDFSGKQNINTGFSIGRLESEGTKHKLRNITIEDENNTSIIQDVQIEIKNIVFENIKLINNSSISKNDFGIILYNYGLIDNIEFKNIELNAASYNGVGCIANNEGEEISNIQLEKIKIIARGNVGSLVGNLALKTLKNIRGEEIEIMSSADNSGGFFGYTTNDDIYKDRTIENITANNIKVKGINQVGGIIGNGRGAKNITATDITVEGNSNVGGVVGSTAFMANSSYNVIKNSTIKGNGNFIGGIGGVYAGGFANRVENCNIEGTSNSKYIGGAYGRVGNTITGIAVINTNINVDGDTIGGITGYIADSTMLYAYTQNVTIRGESTIGGIAGEGTTSYNIYNTYTNVNIYNNGSTVGGIIGYLNNENTSASNNNNFYLNAVYDSRLQGKSNVGGIIGKVNKELYIGQNSKTYSNYVQADLITEDINTVSLGIGSMQNQNQYLQDAYYYKYSTINGVNPTSQNEVFIQQEDYLTEDELKEQTTYTSKLKWTSGNWNFTVLQNNKYPTINSSSLSNQEGIDIPKDSEHNISGQTNSALNNGIQVTRINEDNQVTSQNPEQTFEYAGKQITTYSTYSIIQDAEGNSVKRDAKLYLKEGNLYAISPNIDMVDRNFIIDNYNGKEYETVLGTDGKLYDLKEKLTYPENFKNENIKSIGNNLNTEEKEVEVTYNNGDKIKFNYQTGEIISEEKLDENKTGLIEFIQDKLTTEEDAITTNEQGYENTKELIQKLEEVPVEKAEEIQNNNEQQENQSESQNTNSTNYITTYNTTSDRYEIYNEEELLNTTKQTVETENEKIEKNDLSSFYSAKISKAPEESGKTAIYIIILAVIIVLAILIRYNKNKNKQTKK